MTVSKYSYAYVTSQWRKAVAAGSPTHFAIAHAYRDGRVEYFARHPKGALPAWLAFPKGYRMREHYNADGSPVFESRSGTVFKKNPAEKIPVKEIDKAARLFKRFTGYKPDQLTPVPIKPLPKAALAFGQLVQIGYRSYRDGKLYRHDFKDSSRPLLVATFDGKQVLLLGGAYAFTERGIEDR